MGKPKSADQRRRENRDRQRQRRAAPESRSTEQQRDTAARRRTRSIPGNREEEQQRNTAVRRRTRSVPEVRVEEQQRDTAARRHTRSNPVVREEEQRRDTASRRRTRADPDVREGEQRRDTASRRIVRLQPQVRNREQNSDTASRKRKRSVPEVRDEERVDDRKRRKVSRALFEPKYLSLLAKFEKKKKQAPTSICSCCGGLWYENSVTKMSDHALQQCGILTNLRHKVICLQEIEPQLCRTCKDAVKKGKVPRLSLSNGFAFPEQPQVLKDLTSLEERLVAARIPFMRIKLLGTERQSAISGCIVNVENDLDVTCKVLPRQITDTSLVNVKLMRRMRDKTPYRYERIRPLAVQQAAKYLASTPVYTKENVELCSDWERYNEDDTISVYDQDYPQEFNEANVPQEESLDESDSEEEDNIGNFAEHSFIFHDSDTSTTGIKIAPGEGKIPIPLYKDFHVEELSFPKIYCGQHRKFDDQLRITYTDIVKSALRMFDRRACNVEWLFFAFNKSRIEKIYNAIQVCMRKTTGNDSLTAGDIRRPGSIEALFKRDEGYQVFKHVRSSPPYWQSRSKDVMAMVRQLGTPSLFLTLSAAETKWTELTIMLMKILRGKVITEEEAALVSLQEKFELIRSDPVTCIRHFDHRYRALFTELIQKQNGIFMDRGVKDYFLRMEFQMRGSPHIHALLWLEDTPKCSKTDSTQDMECLHFIDKYITCKRATEGSIEQFMAYQLHNHSHSCYKNQKSKTRCRFGFPKPPMDQTVILRPFDISTDGNTVRAAKANYDKIQTKLKEIGRNYTSETHFDSFISSLNLTREEYILAIRSSLKRVTPFLRRSTSEIYINQYNERLLAAWEANIDIQFVTDPYACAKYCVGYILKSDSGVSKLLKSAASEAKRGNLTLKEKLNRFAKVLITGSEISAQECAAFAFGIANTLSTRDTVYVSTVPPNERVRMLKPREDLDELDDGSTDIVLKGLLEHYAQRPEELETTCLADFATMYEYSKTIENDVDDNELLETPRSSRKLPRWNLKDASGSIRKRSKRKILRYRHYGKADDTGNYWREQVMLFLPWRSESEFNNDTSKGIAEANTALLNLNSKPYFHDPDINEEALDDLWQNAEEDEEESDPVVENNMQFLEDLQEEDLFIENDIFKAKPAPRVEKFRFPNLLPDDQYKTLMRSLNDKQRRFVLNALYLLKTSTKPFYYFLSGGAGVGKSQVVTALVQSYIRYTVTDQNILNPEDMRVLVSAPTGKAAFNVFGMTLHSTFRLPPTKYGGKIGNLDSSTVSTLRLKLKNVNLFIIDEVSMMSVKQLYDIDSRLQQIFESSEDFGGKSIIFVGHLRQLPPVGGSYAFMPAAHISEAAGAVDNYLWEKFQYYELDEVMRQRGEKDFCTALNALSEGRMTPADIRLIQSRKLTDINSPEATTEPLWLFYTRKACAEHNAKVHAKLNTEGALAKAHDKIQGKATEEQKLRFLEYAKTLDAQKSDGLPYETYLKVGGCYYISTNVDVQDGLFNGATGVLRRIEYGIVKDKSSVPKYAWMEFDHSIIGAEARQKTADYQRRMNIPEKYVRIERLQRVLSVARGRSIEIVRSQIPLEAANGMTIHKYQGSSLPLVVVSVKNLKPSQRNYRELIYVACSRATSLSGLFIDGDFIPPLMPNEGDPVSLAISALQKKPMIASFRFLQDHGSDYHRLYYQNINSFLPKIVDLESDQCAAAADIIAIVEPWLLDSDTFGISRFDVIHKSFSSGNRSSEGMLMLGKCGASQTTPTYSKHCNVSSKINCQFLQHLYGNMTVIICYRHPKYSLELFLSQLSRKISETEGPKIVLGDMNVNLCVNATRIVNFFENLDFFR